MSLVLALMQTWMSFLANHSKTDFVKDLDFYEDTTVEEHIFKGAQYAICLIEIFGTGCWYQVLEKSVSELKKKIIWLHGPDPCPVPNTGNSCMDFR